MNCEATLQGRFCHVCGQKDLGSRLSLREVISEFFAEVLEIEGKLPSTVLSLAFRPGHYLDNYLSGKRASFSSPLRFYLLVAFMSLIVIGWAGESGVRRAFQANQIVISNEGGKINFSFSSDEALLTTFLPAPHHVSNQCDAIDAVLPFMPTCLPPEPHDWLESLDADPTLQCPPAPLPSAPFEEKWSAGFVAFVDGKTEEAVSLEFWKETLQALPFTLSLLIGWSVLLLKLMFWRGEATTHVLTAITLHGVMMLALSLNLLLPWNITTYLLMIWAFAHVVFGLRAAYGVGWARMGLTVFVLFFPWLFGVSTAVGFAMFLAAFQIFGAA